MRVGRWMDLVVRVVFEVAKSSVTFLGVMLVFWALQQISLPARFSHIRTAEQVTVGDPLPFLMRGEQSKGCIAPTARVLVYDDGTVLPLTDTNYPNFALLENAAHSQPLPDTKALVSFALHTRLPLPSSYIHPGRAFFLQEIDDTPCGPLRGLVPALPHVVISNWFTILPKGVSHD